MHHRPSLYGVSCSMQWLQQAAPPCSPEPQRSVHADARMSAQRGWHPPVVICSVQVGVGINEMIEMHVGDVCAPPHHHSPPLHVYPFEASRKKGGKQPLAKAHSKSPVKRDCRTCTCQRLHPFLQPLYTWAEMCTLPGFSISLNTIDVSKNKNDRVVISFTRLSPRHD